MQTSPIMSDAKSSGGWQTWPLPNSSKRLQRHWLARAAITWLAEFDDGCIPETSGKYLRTLLRAPLFAA
jgi:streptogramin lyase